MAGPRQLLQRAYVLHHHPYRDSSALVEIFSEHHGRVGLVARGVRGRRNPRQALLQPFTPLLLSWSGRGDLMTLVDVEAEAPNTMLQGMVLMSGFYVNELLLRLLRRRDPHPRLFLYYDQLLQRLARLEGDNSPELAVALRLFEKVLLDEIGYGLALACDGLGEAIEADRFYRYSSEQGAVAVQPSEPGAIPGRALLALAAGELDGEAAQAVRRLLRRALDQQLGEAPLKSRQMLLEMQRMTHERD